MLRKIILSMFLAAPGPIAFAQGMPVFVLSQHQLTLQAYLTKHANLALLPESVCQCDAELIQLRTQAAEFQPYYAVGDINDDQIEDFAVALGDKNNLGSDKPQFSLVIFHGPFLPGKANRGIEVIKNYKVDRPKEVLSVFKSRVEAGIRIPARLDVGPGIFGSDDVHVIFYDRKLKRYSVKYFYDE